MNSLEYIDKQILFVKQNIQYHKDLLTTTNDNESIEIIKSTIKLLEPDLQTLKQIKSKLEAWEVCKKHLILDKEFHQINLHLHHDTKYKEDYIKIKKALEVEDNVD